MKNLISILLILFAASCSPKVAYHNGIKDKYKLEETEIKKIQFYTSGDIVLYKSESESARKTDKGELVVSNKTEEDRLIIRKGTPGVVIKIEGQNKMLISFETDEKTLTFESVNNTGEYKLKVDEWVNGKGKLTYGNQVYYATQENGSVFLTFKIKKLNKKKSTDKVIDGRKLD